jgi:hypothetical protein
VNHFMTKDSKRQAGATKGCEFYRSAYESTGLGDVDERCASLEGSGKTPANLFSHDPRGKVCG